MAAYNLKRVLLALRKEYLENRNKIENLRQYINIKNPNITGYDLTEYEQGVNKYIEILLHKNESLFQSIYEKIMNGFKDPKECLAISRALSGEDRSIVFPTGSLDSDFDYEYRFLIEADKILCDSFIYHISTPPIRSLEGNTTIQFTPNNIITRFDDGKDTPFEINYNGDKDIVRITSSHKPVRDKLVLEVLSQEFDSNDFPKYHKQIIESSCDTRSIGVIGLDRKHRSQTFDIMDYPDKCYLRSQIKK